MSSMHTITESDKGAAFSVKTKGENGQDVTKHFLGNAYLHPSGTLFVHPKDEAPVYYGPGQWVTLQLQDQPEGSKGRMWAF